MNQAAERARDIEPFRVMAILARARAMQAAGRDIIHLEVGEPDFPTPAPIVEAGIQALRAGHTHYTPALGLPELRQAIAEYYRQRHGVTVTAKRVAITPGASGALQLIMAALINPGEQILLADPGYPCNRHFARLFEIEAIGVPVSHESGFQLTADLVARYWRPSARGVLIANPGNPTGTVLPADELRAIHQIVRAQGGWLIVDEIYHELIYGLAQPSAAGLADDVIVINSFSKYWLMTGWRLGWLLAPEALMPALDRLAQNLFLAAPTVAQYAALAALSEKTRIVLEAHKDELRQRLDFIVPVLRRLGFAVTAGPQGAFYVYADISSFGQDGETFANALLERTGVAITPGTDFGRFRASEHVRFACTTTTVRMEEALARVAVYLEDMR